MRETERRERILQIAGALTGTLMLVLAGVLAGAGLPGASLSLASMPQPGARDHAEGRGAVESAPARLRAAEPRVRIPRQGPRTGHTNAPSRPAADSPSSTPSRAPTTQPTTQPSTEAPIEPSTSSSAAPSTAPSTAPSAAPPSAPPTGSPSSGSLSSVPPFSGRSPVGSAGTSEAGRAGALVPTGTAPAGTGAELDDVAAATTGRTPAAQRSSRPHAVPGHP
ncbi:hypothetical protein ACQEUU_18280 [Nonomuraea sp. CA-218870]|uniref:hypothetical protein n=1 Tax=Nonomuraea sp. CA-218870 TaxID=3239998 RepID=UPI003D91ABAC